MDARKLRPDSRFVHAAQEPDAQTGAVVAPIHLATTYAQEAIGPVRPKMSPTRIITGTAEARSCVP